MILQLVSYLAITQGDCDAEKTRKFLGIIPKWYEYLNYVPNQLSGDLNRCEIQLEGITKNPQELWLIALAAIDILLRIGGMVAVAFVIYGGFRYLTSQGEPENTSAALHTIINALIGVGITVIAAAVVGFVAGKLV